MVYDRVLRVARDYAEVQVVGIASPLDVFCGGSMDVHRGF